MPLGAAHTARVAVTMRSEVNKGPVKTYILPDFTDFRPASDLNLADNPARKVPHPSHTSQKVKRTQRTVLRKGFTTAFRLGKSETLRLTSVSRWISALADTKASIAPLGRPTSSLARLFFPTARQHDNRPP
jgi:hypothetical protein